VVDHAAWRAIGTSVHLLTDGLDAHLARRAVEDVIEAVDLTYSRFRADSELRLLQASPSRTARVSPLLADAISVALDAARWTEGAVDPTVGRAMRAIGYDDTFARVAGRATMEIILAGVPGWRAVTFDRSARTVRLPKGVELDLGSTGKALAAELAATAALGGRTDAGVLVSLGGDIAIAGRAPAGGWRVLIAEDADIPPDTDGEVVSLEAGALATSSTTVRRWTAADATSVHHLIDPSTGAPARGPWRTVTVTAGRCVDANAAATATIVLGDAGLAWLERTGLPGRLVATDGDVVRVGGWPEPEASLAS
jgi:FAD:protein FMN transferase